MTRPLAALLALTVGVCGCSSGHVEERVVATSAMGYTSAVAGANQGEGV